MFGSMFSQEDSILGFPTSIVVMVVGVVGALVGLAWIRRIARVEESSSFRLSSRPTRDSLAIIAILAVVILLATVYWLAFGR